MEIVDLTKENVSLALCCESNGGYFELGVQERRKFLLWKLEQGKVRGKMAVEEGQRLGWIDYYPREDGWFRIACILVSEEHRGRGVGRALVSACLEDCMGSKGVLVGATVWDHMPKAFFKKLGFLDLDPEANVSIMVMKLGEEELPKPREKKEFAAEPEAGKLAIDMFDDGQCPTSCVTRQLVKEAARDFANKILVRDHDLKDEAEAKRFGDTEGIFLDGEEAFFGYPGRQYLGMIEKIRETVRKRLETKTTQ